VINRSILATVYLALALMPSAGGWHAHNTAISRHEIISNGQWIRTSREEKPAYTAVKKHSEGVTTHKNIARMNKQQNQSPAQLWQNLEILLNQSEFQQIPIIGTLLAERLRKLPDPEVYQSITDLVLQPNEPMENKAILLDLLAEIATPDSLTELINLAERGLDSSLYILVLQAISRIGENRWDGEFHEELSPVLEAAWSSPEITDQAFLGAIGKAIAEVGAPEGVDQLLQTVSGSNNGKELEETHRIKQEVAFDVIPTVRNPEAIEVLGTPLEQEPLETPAFEASFNALAKIGSPVATQKIVNWAIQAPAEAARHLRDGLSKIDNDNALKPISAAQNMEFESTEIKDVIDTFAASIDSKTTLSPTTAGEESSTVLPPPLIGEADRNN